MAESKLQISIYVHKYFIDRKYEFSDNIKNGH